MTLRDLLIKINSSYNGSSVQDANEDTELLGVNAQKSGRAFDRLSDKVSRMGNQANQIDKLNDQTESLNRIVEKATTKTSQLGDEVSGLGHEAEALDKITQKTRRIGEEAENASKKFKSLSDRIETMSDKANKFGGNMQSAGADFAAPFLASGAAVGAGLFVMGKKAADFEQQLSSVKSLLSTDEFTKFGGALEKLAIDMGEKTKYSAMESAQGIEELIKAGVGVTDIVNGGLEGALTLAVAGNLDLAKASEITSTALNAFSADNLTVSKAADILAGGANASATSVEELQYGLSQVSAVASGVGLSFKDTSTALAVFANNGLKGSDAGTSLKTMLMNLIPQTDKEASMFADLGLMTEKGTSAFFDAEGQMKSLSQISGMLQSSLSDMTSEQRLSTLEMLFGSDAVRAANILYKEGSKGFNDMQEAMSKVTVADVAATKMDNLKGRIEELSGSVETLGISMGQHLLPIVDKAVLLTQKLVDKFNGLSPAMQENIVHAMVWFTTIAGIGVVIGTFFIWLGMLIQSFGAMAAGLAFLVEKLSIFKGFLSKLGQSVMRNLLVFRMFGPALLGMGAAGVAAKAVAALSFALRLIGGPIGLAITAVFMLGSYLTRLYQRNEEFRNRINGIWSSVVSVYQTSIDYIGKKFSEFTGWMDGLRSELQAVGDYFANAFSGIGNTVATLSPIIARMGLAFLGVSGPIGWVIATVISLGAFLYRLINDNEAVKTSIMNAWSSIQNAFAPILAILEQVGTTFLTMLGPAIAEFASAFEVLGPEFQKTGQILSDSFVQLGPSFAELGAAFAELGSTGAVLFSTLATTMVPMFLEIGTTLLPLLVTLFTTFAGVLSSLAVAVLPLLGQIFITVFSTVATILQTVIPFIITLLLSIVPIVLNLVMMILPLILQVVQMIFPMVLMIIQTVLPIVVQLFLMIISVILQVAQVVLPLIMSVVQMVFPLIMTIIQAVIPIITGLLLFAASIITNTLIPAIQIILSVIQFVFPLIMVIIQTAIDIITGIITTATALLKGDWEGAWNSIKETAETIMGNIIGFFEGIDLFSVGSNIIQGLIGGIGSMVGAVTGKVKEVASGIMNTFTGFLGIESPSVVFKGYGMDTGAGYNIGLENMMDSTYRTSEALAQTAMDPFNPTAGFSPSTAPVNNSRGGDNYDMSIEVNLSGQATQEDADRVGDSVMSKFEEFFGGMNRRMPVPQEL